MTIRTAPYGCLRSPRGCARAKILALRWRDADLDAGAVRVPRNVQRVWKQGLVESTTKSRRPRRVMLSGIIVAALLDWRKVPDKRPPDALVFSNRSGHVIEVSNLRKRYWLPLLERAGIEHLRIHELRHAAATLLLRLGVPPRVVADTLGHADSSVTMRVYYSHVLPTLHEEAAGDYGRLLERLSASTVPAVEESLADAQA